MAEEAAATAAKLAAGTGSGDSKASAAPQKAEGAAAIKRIKKGGKTLLRRPRGRRGGMKHRKGGAASQAIESNVKTAGKKVQAGQKAAVSKAKASLDGTADAADETAPLSTSTEHAKAIARFHTLEKQLAQTKDPKERARLEAEQAKLGGLAAYQDASLVGGCKLRGGETGKWCAEQLSDVLAEAKPSLRLLDVGALQGTAYDKYPWIKTVSIDINPRSENVIQSDFFSFPVPIQDAERFDVVALSLVVNFLGDIAARGQMLRHALKYLKKDGARLLYLVLPRACVENSRYCTHEHLQSMLKSCGWDDVVRQDDSARLTRWLVRSTSPKAKWDGQTWKKQEVRVGKTLNNFCIVVK